MPWQRVEAMVRHYAGRRAPIECQIKKGDRVRPYTLKRKGGGYITNPTEGVVTEEPKWQKKGETGQYLITESHETRTGNISTRTLPGGYTEFDVWLEEGETLPQQKLERPPFDLGEFVRFKRREDESWITDARVQGIWKADARTAREPKWQMSVAFKLGPELVPGEEVINYASQDIEAMSSRMHPLPSYNSSKK